MPDLYLTLCKTADGKRYWDTGTEPGTIGTRGERITTFGPAHFTEDDDQRNALSNLIDLALSAGYCLFEHDVDESEGWEETCPDCNFPVSECICREEVTSGQR